MLYSKRHVSFSGRRQTSGWPEMDPLHPYCTGEEQTVEESLQPSHNGNGKVVRRLSKKMTTSRAKTSWTGTRVELQLWCQAEDVPERMLSEDYRTALQNYQGEYHFNNPLIYLGTGNYNKFSRQFLSTTLPITFSLCHILLIGMKRNRSTGNEGS